MELDDILVILLAGGAGERCAATCVAGGRETWLKANHPPTPSAAMVAAAAGSGFAWPR